MSVITHLGLSAQLTHKANLRETRYGWLRLTPAHSVHLVREILRSHVTPGLVLDPFCGTGTTALVCGEEGVPGITTDINPFLIWLARVKTCNYEPEDIRSFQEIAKRIGCSLSDSRVGSWVPDLHQIERWWDDQTVNALAGIADGIRKVSGEASEQTLDLLRMAFCRVLIDSSNVSFAHQSMSFKSSVGEQLLFPDLAPAQLVHSWTKAADALARSAQTVIRAIPRIILCDARSLEHVLEPESVGTVITSPPYPNRMSYIRELRPYMYWLGYLSNGRDAGEMDWQAIGGTWGCATSNVAKWRPDEERPVPYAGYQEILIDIALKSRTLSNYVQKYFYDMVAHVGSMCRVLMPGATVHYIVGNSKFYDVMLPVEEIYAALFRGAGFEQVSIRAIRKRTSKKELYEYVVSAIWP